MNVANGMRFLSDDFYITHLDLKPINVMVSRNLIAKIVDFGEAHHK
jgi:serine/threonine protein kinase